jgi:hypothetical protein
MAPVLDIFEHRFGDATKPTKRLASDTDTDSLGEVGLAMLDAVQTVVDVLADEKNKGFRVSFAPTTSAYSSDAKRRIVISGLPLMSAPAGTPYRDIAAILTGFAVHEIGHTKRVGIIDAVRNEWPGKKLPPILGNIVEDIVLEARVIERYAGLRDVFQPTFDWVARTSCPTYPIAWSGSTGHKVNVIGQMVRYRDYVTFAGDALTQKQLRWFDEWAARITAKTTPAEGVALVREALARIHDTADEDEPGEGEDEQPKGKGKGKGKDTDTLPDEDDTEGDDGDGDGDGEGNGGDDDDTEGDSGDGDADGEGQGQGTEGDSDADGEGGDGEGEDGEGANTSDAADAQANRIETGEGANDGTGAGGSGQAIADAGVEDPDLGLDEHEVDKSYDEQVHPNQTYADSLLQREVDEERISERINAGIYGRMKVIFRD